MRELLEDYKSKVLIPFKPKEARTQGPQIDWWIEKLGNYSLADITPAAIAKCRDELLTTPIGTENKKLRAPATVIRYMAGLSQAFKVAVNEWQWMPESPMAKVSKPKVNNERLRHLSADEQTRLLDAAKLSANTYVHTILVLALSTGMRYSEIMTLRWGDVLIEDTDEIGLILLEKTKNGDATSLILSSMAVHIDLFGNCNSQINKSERLLKAHHKQLVARRIGKPPAMDRLWLRLASTMGRAVGSPTDGNRLKAYVLLAELEMNGISVGTEIVDELTKLGMGSKGSIKQTPGIWTDFISTSNRSSRFEKYLSEAKKFCSQDYKWLIHTQNPPREALAD
jgi:integrase